MGNSLGKIFTVTSFGESHGRYVGVIVDGCPAGLPLSEADIQPEVDRRRAGQTAGSTARQEKDVVEILSGVYRGHTTGAPICLIVPNRDVDSRHYEQNRLLSRPGHADFTAYTKYGGFNDPRGGGRFSGRTTVSLVMAGAIARKLLLLNDTEILAHTVAIGGIQAKPMDIHQIRQNRGGNSLRCADPDAAREMAKVIEEAARQKDSVGGIIEGIALNVPAGLGEPVFDNLDGELARAMFSIPAVKAVEFGAGFPAAGMRGSEHNDPFTVRDGKIVTTTNNAGGILGGLSSGMPVVLRVAVKPTPSISREQATVDLGTMADTMLSISGRHDVCIVPRAVPVVEAMMAITLIDFALRAGIIPGVIK